jgi:type VII secretion protein EccB
MASRRDQLQSYQFLTQRVISAFVMRETDPAQSPLRRGVGALFAGLMIAVLFSAGFGVYGLLVKVGSNNWRSEGAVIVEKESGAAFVYQGGKLHPTLNYASALLVSGKPAAQVFREPGSALAGVPRTTMVGIPGAPSSLPPAGDMLAGPWMLCSSAGVDAANRPTATTTVAVAATAPADAPALATGTGLLVRSPDNSSLYLIAGGYRFQITDNLQTALFGVVTPTTVGTAWLNGIPRGADISPLRVPNAGNRSPAVAGHDIGEVLSAQVGTGTQYYLVFEDGLAPISETQKDIAVGQGLPQPVQVRVNEATDAAKSTHLQPAADVQPLPAKPPTPVQPPKAGSPICAEFPNANDAPGITVGGSSPPAGTPTVSHTGTGASLADRVAVPGGHVLVARVAGGYDLVTDLGVRYPVPSDDALAMLGYPLNKAVSVPDALLRMIPAGPALDPAAAAAAAPLTNATNN